MHAARWRQQPAPGHPCVSGRWPASRIGDGHGRNRCSPSPSWLRRTHDFLASWVEL